MRKRTPKTYSYEERVGISQEDNCGQRYQRRGRSRMEFFHFCSKRSQNGFSKTISTGLGPNKSQGFKEKSP